MHAQTEFVLEVAWMLNEFDDIFEAAKIPYMSFFVALDRVCENNGVSLGDFQNKILHG